MIQKEAIIGRKQYFEWRRSVLNEVWFTDEQGIVHIPLRGGLEAIIEKVDELLAKRFLWRLRTSKGKFYAEATKLEDERICDGQKKWISLHRLIMGFPVDMQVDHANGDSLDCRRSNLRVATASQNASNRKYVNKTGYRGVVKPKKGRGYIAQCQHKGVNRNLGYFKTAEEAALAYNAFAAEIFGEFAVLNEVAA
jgi:hypothetical protein